MLFVAFVFGIAVGTVITAWLGKPSPIAQVEREYARYPYRRKRSTGDV